MSNALHVASSQHLVTGSAISSSLPAPVAAAAAAAAAAVAATRAKQRIQPTKTTKPTGMTLIVERRLSQASERARQMAAVILDVLGGNRTPTDAAQAIGLSVARYYVVEQRAVLGLVDACEVQPKRGPHPDLERQIHKLEQDNRELNQAVLRQQAIVRSTQRSLGISLAKPAVTKLVSGKNGKLRRSRRPSIRALRQAQRIAPAVSPVASPAVADIMDGDQRGG